MRGPLGPWALGPLGARAYRGPRAGRGGCRVVVRGVATGVSDTAAGATAGVAGAADAAATAVAGAEAGPPSQKPCRCQLPDGVDAAAAAFVAWRSTRA